MFDLLIRIWCIFVRKLLALLFILSFSFYISGFTEMVVPAINGDHGVATYISASAYNVPQKEAGTYIDVDPFFSIDTQQSAKIATQVAANFANHSLNDTAVLFKIRSTSVQSVEGPSGGLALSLLAYAELTGKSFRSDYTISSTGTISPDGSVGLVGGVNNKITAAKDVNVNLILIPLGQSDADGIDYSAINDSKVKVIEVKNFSEAVSIVFAQPTTPLPVFNRTSYYDLRDVRGVYPKTEFFKDLAQNQLKISQNAFESILSSSDPSIQQNKRIMQRTLQEAQNAFDKGYYYTSGNSAFLTSIRFDVLSQLLKNVTKDQVLSLVDDQLKIANSIVFKTPSKKEVGLYGGAVVRYYWAVDKLNSVKQNIDSDSLDNLLTDVYSAKYWLVAAQYLNDQIQGGTDLLQESSLQKLASDSIKNVEATNSTDQQFLDHLRTARQMFYDGKYVGSMYDSAFALVTVQSDALAANYSPSDLVKQIDTSPRISLWGQLYYSQADYYLQTANSGNEADIIKSAFLLSLLSKRVDQIDLTIAGSSLQDFEYSSPSLQNDYSIQLALLGGLLLTGIVFFLTFKNAIQIKPQPKVIRKKKK
ncbi:Archaeal Lon protease [uncultured archaeon]|nr:Archaeal Lon protease [uncultured archaeon]